MFLYSLISAHISCCYSNNKCEELLPYPVKKYLNRKISYFFSFIPKKHYTFALAIETIHLFKLQNGNHHWRDGRVVDYNGLENRRAERHRGFESLSLRIAQRVKSLSYNNLGTFYLSILKSCPTFCPKVALLFAPLFAPLFSPKICSKLKNTFSCKENLASVIICLSANNRSRKK